MEVENHCALVMRAQQQSAIGADAGRAKSSVYYPVTGPVGSKRFPESRQGTSQGIKFYNEDVLVLVRMRVTQISASIYTRRERYLIRASGREKINETARRKLGCKKRRGQMEEEEVRGGGSVGRDSVELASENLSHRGARYAFPSRYKSPRVLLGLRSDISG